MTSGVPVCSADLASENGIVFVALSADALFARSSGSAIGRDGCTK